MDFTERIFSQCRQNLQTSNAGNPSTGVIVLPESTDLRVLEAATLAAQQGLVAEILFIGDLELSQRIATEAGLTLPVRNSKFRGCRWLPLDRNIPGGPLANRKPSKLSYSDSYNLDDSIIRQQALWQAATLVKEGTAHASLAGAIAPTAEVIRTGLKVIGCAPGITTVSGAFFMHKKTVQENISKDVSGSSPLVESKSQGSRNRKAPDQNSHLSLDSQLKTLLFADAAVVAQPSVEQLVDIAAATVATWRQVMDEEPPQVAFLSFSTKGSAKHPTAEHIGQAAMLFRNRYPEVASDGEVQLDAALVPAIRQQKAPLESFTRCSKLSCVPFS